MPSKSPPVAPQLLARLAALGAQIRDVRRQQKVGAAMTAEAASMSRVTLYRIERLLS